MQQTIRHSLISGEILPTRRAPMQMLGDSLTLIVIERAERVGS